MVYARTFGFFVSWQRAANEEDGNERENDDRRRRTSAMLQRRETGDEQINSSEKIENYGGK